MASSDYHDRFVQLKDGPVLPVEPYLLALELETRGFTLAREEGEVLSVQPYERLTRQDYAAIRRWKWHLLALIDYIPPVDVQ
jgi:hypothetical protein